MFTPCTPFLIIAYFLVSRQYQNEQYLIYATLITVNDVKCTDILQKEWLASTVRYDINSIGADTIIGALPETNIVIWFRYTQITHSLSFSFFATFLTK